MNIRKILCAILLCLALLCAAALAEPPAPSEQYYFLDKANVLTEDTEGEIFFSNQLLDEACDAQIVVVTVDSTKPASIEDYSYDLFNAWGIGDKDKLNGFLLLLAIDDEEYYAVCGADLLNKFSRGTLKQYFDQYLENDFAAANYDAGVKAFFEAVYKRVADTYNANVTTAQGIAAYQEWAAQPDPEPMSASGGGGYNRSAAGGYDYDDDEPDLSNGFLVVIVVVLLLMLMLATSRRRRYFRTYGYYPTSFFFFGSPWRRNPPPPPRPGMGPQPGPGGYRGVPGPRPSSGRSSYTGPGLGDFLRGSGFGGAGRSSGGAGRSSFGGSRSFGSARGGGGFTRGGGAGRGRH